MREKYHNTVIYRQNNYPFIFLYNKRRMTFTGKKFIFLFEQKKINVIGK
jgi:hypothetical protein